MGAAEHGVVGHAVEVLDIAEVSPLLAEGGRHPFTAAELAFARARSDPERRLAWDPLESTCRHASLSIL